MQVRFRAKKVKLGGSWYVLVPKAISLMLDEREYEYYIEEVKDYVP